MGSSMRNVRHEQFCKCPYNNNVQGAHNLGAHSKAPVNVKY